MQKCIVGRVVDDEASSTFDKLLQLLLNTRGPFDSFLRVAAIEIIDDNLIAGEDRAPLVECLRSDGRDIDTEASCFIKNGANASRSRQPNRGY